jgi:hypothetical protein
MELMLVLLAVISLIELSLWQLKQSTITRNAALIIALLQLVACFGLMSRSFTIWTVLITLLSFYRCINAIRYSRSETQTDYLLHRIRRTAYWLIGLQLVIAVMAWLVEMPTWFWLYGLAYLQLFTASLIFISTVRHLRKTSPPRYAQALADKDLPTVSVAIPARNETQELEACLQSLAASDYPKPRVVCASWLVRLHRKAGWPRTMPIIN